MRPAINPTDTNSVKALRQGLLARRGLEALLSTSSLILEAGRHGYEGSCCSQVDRVRFFGVKVRVYITLIALVV